METILRLLFRVITFLFVIGGIGSAFVLILTFADDIKVLFEKPHSPHAFSAPETQADSVAHSSGRA